MEHWPLRKVVWAVLAMFAVYFPIALCLKHIYVPEPKQTATRTSRFKPWPLSSPRTKAYVFDAPEQDGLADSPDNTSRSPLLVYENDRPLGPPHSGHQAIVTEGRGRYSHWKGLGVIFSTGDNSDPNSNGNRYTIRLDEK